MTKKKVYISLPISGFDIKIVRERAERAVKYLTERGFEAVTPFDVSPNEEASYAEHMGKDIHALLECDAVFFLRGWENSKGCQLERHAAMIYGKEMMHDASMGGWDFERVLPYPPFMPGEVVTYNDCLSSKAVYSHTLPDKNDSGDDCFYSLVAKLKEEIYHGSCVFASDIRLAKPIEVLEVFHKLDNDMIKQKAKIKHYGDTIVAFLKAGVASENEIIQNPKAYECGSFDCTHRRNPLSINAFTVCKIKECKGRTPYTPKEGDVSCDVSYKPVNGDGIVFFNDEAETNKFVMGFDPAKENENEG